MKIFTLFLLLIPIMSHPQDNSRLESAQQPDYCDFLDMYLFAQDSAGQYLGKLSRNKYAAESIINEFGDYGSIYSSTSILNKFSDYGSENSSFSAYNKFASYPPIVYKLADDVYTPTVFLTKNPLQVPALDPDVLITMLKNGCDNGSPTDHDLLAFLIWISEKDYFIGDSVEINYTIFNNSISDLNTVFYTSLSLDSSIVDSCKTANLARKTSIQGSARVKLTSNIHCIILNTDYTSLVSESNEANNRTSLIIHPKIPATGTGQISATEQVLFYPNPVGLNGCVYIHSDTFYTRIAIYNINGQLILDKLIQNNLIDLSTENIQKGIYLIQLYHKQGYVVKRMIVS